MPTWEPTATLGQLRLFAQVLQYSRSYLQAEGLLEVVTPSLSRFANTDPHIESLRTTVDGVTRFLHTSPEFPMKRILAAYQTSIFQIATVFRNGELGARHNAEFTLLEWYRVGFDHQQLMLDVDALIQGVFEALGKTMEPTITISYVQKVQELLGMNFNDIAVSDIKSVFVQSERSFPSSIDDLDDALNLFVDEFIVQEFSSSRLTFLVDYPASQAALARVTKNADGCEVAERFEAFIGSVELANGFHELSDAAEQRVRFDKDNLLRASRTQTVMPVDDHLISALDAGFPDCAGVALGLDRLCMVVAGATHINQVQSFGGHNA